MAAVPCDVTSTLLDTDSPSDVSSGKVVIAPNSATWQNSTAAVGRFFGRNYRFVNTGYSATTFVEFKPTLPANGLHAFDLLSPLLRSNLFPLTHSPLPAQAYTTPCSRL